MLYSPDGGSSWLPLGVQLETTSLTVDTDLLAGGTAARIRVVATDGFNAGSAESGLFSVPTKPPYAFIATPADDTLFRTSETLSLSGGAQDAEDGQLTDSHLVWTSGATMLGTGSRLTIPASILGPSSHTVTLTATDTDMQSHSAAIALHIDDADVRATCKPHNTALFLGAGDPVRCGRAGLGSHLGVLPREARLV